MTRPRKDVLLCAPDGVQASILKVVLQSQLEIWVKQAEGLGVVAALHGEDEFHCAVLLLPYPQTVSLLKKYEIPTLAVGKMESGADRTIPIDPMGEVIDAVKLMCARKRGPKVRAA